MNLIRSCGVALAWSLVVGCADSETIIALNINSDAAAVGDVASLTIQFSQGSETLEKTLVPTKGALADGAPAIAEHFYQRYGIPDSWVSGDAMVEVEAFDEDGGFIVGNSTEFRLYDNRTTAVFVELGFPPEEPDEPAPTEAGAPSDQDAAPEPTETDPAETDPGMTDPGMTDAGMTDAGMTDPVEPASDAGDGGNDTSIDGGNASDAGDAGGSDSGTAGDSSVAAAR